MSIFLTILKWLGIVIGGVLGAIIVLLLLVLLVPVRYRVTAILDKEKSSYGYRVSWLFPVVMFSKGLQGTEAVLRIFGIPFRKKKKKAKKNTGKPVEKDETKETETIREERKEEKPAENPNPKIKAKSNKKKQKKKHRKKRFSFKGVSDIIKEVGKLENKRAIRFLWKEFKALLHELRPRKVKGDLVLGTGDPCSTGLAIGGISMFPIAYDDDVHIVPDFEQAICQGQGVIKGRIQVLYLVKLLLRLYKNRNLKKAYRNLKKKK